MATTATKDVEQSALNYMNELQGQQTAAFGENQAALSAINSAWAPVLATGAVPYGYSAGLDSLLKSNIINQGAQATTNSENASQLRQRQASGGAPGAAPQGANEAINAAIEAKGQQSTAENLANEKIAGYEQGTKNLEGATQAELGIAGGANDVGLAGATTGEGALGLNAAQAEWKQDQTSSPAAILGDVGQAAKDATAIFG
jgi:hypothetical protein